MQVLLPEDAPVFSNYLNTSLLNIIEYAYAFPNNVTVISRAGV